MRRDTSIVLYNTSRADASYANIWGFTTAGQRTSFLQSRIRKSIQKCKYWRPGAPIYVDVPYEDSFDIDYAVITNHQSTSERREWYCFVTGRAYISDKVTLLQVDIDLVQTFYFTTAPDGGKVPFWSTSGFITRSTNGDLKAPRGTASEYPVPVAVNNFFTGPLQSYYTVIYSTLDPNGELNTNTTAVIDGVFMSSVPYIYKSASPSSIIQALTTLLNKYNTAGKTDAISGIYLIPAIYLNVATISNYIDDYVPGWTSNLYQTIDQLVPAPTSCQGYTPTNKQLLGHDYSYFVVNNGQGETQTYHFEDFSGTPTFKIRVSLSAGSPTLICYPSNYIAGNDDDSRQRAMKITQAPSCTWVNDSYRIWLAQTQNSRAAAYNQAAAAIEQARFARDNSLAYKLSQQVNGPIQKMQAAFTDIGTQLGNELDTKLGLKGSAATSGRFLSANDRALMSQAQKIPALEALAGRGTTGSSGSFGGGTSVGGGAGRSFGDPTPGASINTSFAQAGEVFALAAKRLLGIESAYQYDFNVTNAQLSMESLVAGWQDKSVIPPTAVGSNAYGDLCALGQYGFMFTTFTPSAEYALILDQMLSASGHIVNKYGSIVQKHKYFDYYSAASAYVPYYSADRPPYVTRMLRDLLNSGVYLWYYVDGDISGQIGNPYAMNNPEV